jgi:hypothetical protein
VDQQVAAFQQLVGLEGIDVQSAGAFGFFAAQTDRAGAVGPGKAAFRGTAKNGKSAKKIGNRRG